MYKIKQKPEDFVVKEVSTVKIGDKGQYSYFLLKKTDYTTIDAIKRIANFLDIQLKNIGIAGTKDRKAITEQVISIKNIDEKRLEKFRQKDIELEFLGKGDSPVSLGDLEGNCFEITARDCEKKPEQISYIINYFDSQRFSENNHLVGKAIVKGDLEKAVQLMNEKEVNEYLTKKPTDYVGALKQLPKKILTLYVHAYQSYLWNRTVYSYLRYGRKIDYNLGKLVFPEEKPENIPIPIIGFDIECENERIMKKIGKIMEEEGVKERDFVIRKIPELSAEGGNRDLVAEVKELKIEDLGDNDYKIKFCLQKGSYATIAVKLMF
jgi:tRNA pseudouridine13 synthase